MQKSEGQGMPPRFISSLVLHPPRIVNRNSLRSCPFQCTYDHAYQILLSSILICSHQKTKATEHSATRVNRHAFAARNPDSPANTEMSMICSSVTRAARPKERLKRSGGVERPRSALLNNMATYIPLSNWCTKTLHPTLQINLRYVPLHLSYLSSMGLFPIEFRVYWPPLRHSWTYQRKISP